MKVALRERSVVVVVIVVLVLTGLTVLVLVIDVILFEHRAEKKIEERK